VASDADGNFVVVWESHGQDGDGFGIYAQRFTAAGAAVGGEFRVNTTTTRDQTFPSVAMDADGDFVVVWQSRRSGTSDYDLFAQRYTASGAAAGGELPVGALVQRTIASVAMDRDGNFVVAWLAPSPQGIYARRYTASGAAAGGQVRVNTAPDVLFSPSVAVDPDGDFVVTWVNYAGDGSVYGVYAQRYNAAGATVGGEFRVNTHTMDIQREPTVAAFADGGFVVAWQSRNQDGSGYGIYAQRYNAAGAAAGGEFRVNSTTAGSQEIPSVAVDSEGGFVVAWQSNGQDGSGYGIYAQRYNAAGAAAGGEFRVNSFTAGNQGAPAVAAAADGDFFVTWHSLGQDGSRYGIYAQRYTHNERPTTLSISTVNVRQDEPDTTIDLFNAFADSTDPDPLLTYSVVANTNPALFSGTPISVGPAAGTLTLDYAPGRSGTARLTVRATDTGGLFVDTSFDVIVNPGPPAVTSSEFVYDLGPPQRLRFAFDQDVRASLSAADLTVERVGAGGGPVPVADPTYDAATNTATFSFPAGTLPNGNYRATLAAAGVTNASGTPMAASYVIDFFVLTGDINRDRAVNGTDFAILAGNFGKSATSYAQGDLNGDGFVNGSDFALLAGNFGRTVPAPAAALTAAKSSPETAALASSTLKHAAADRHRRLARRAGAKTQQQRQRQRKIP
jgi:hypothetical protein